MEEPASLGRVVAFTVVAYPLHLSRTLVQLGYEPVRPDANANLPNLFKYCGIISEQRGPLALFTGLKYLLPAVLVKHTSYELMASATNHKKSLTSIKNSDVSEIVAICLRESALRIHSTILAYPLQTLFIGYISSVFFNTKETVEYTLQNLYKGIVPKLIMDVTVIWVGIISRRITANLIQDEVGHAIVSRIPSFIVQSLMYPFNVVSVVMADNGRSRMNPKFDEWRQCYKYLSANYQLKRGSSLFLRRDYQLTANSKHIITRYF